jgi:DNA topoisomerase-2
VKVTGVLAAQAEARRKWLLAAEAAVAGGAAPSAVNATGNPLLPGTVSKTEAAAATSSTYSEFINRDLVEFSRADLYRSIPSGIDGLKPSQRKVLFAALKRGASEIKVAQLAGYCSEHTAYHHGEASLLATIVNLAQDFVGSNNVPLLLPVGQFGTRLMGGRDAASARYIYTKVNPLTRLLLPPDDDACLEYVEDDGQLVEPVHYVPILPLVLVNGAEGIGTGWSTYVPCFNPLEVSPTCRMRPTHNPLRFTGMLRVCVCVYVQIVDVMVAKLGVAQQQTAGVQAELSPWYNGFRGTVSRSGTSWLTRGSCEMESEAVVRIRELPVGRWTDDFKASLVAMVEKGIVHSFREFHTVTDVDFLVKLTPDGQGAVVDVGPDALFKLKSSIPMSNMHLFDAHGKIKKYASAMEVIDDHMPVRLAVYQRRRARQLKELDSRVQLLENRARFISEIIDGRVKVAKQSKAELEQQLRLGRYAPMSTIRGDASADAGDAPARRHDFDYLLNAPLHSLTSDAVANAVKEIGAVRAERDTVDATREEEVWARELLAFKAAVQPSLVLAPHDRVASKTVRGRKKQQ